MQLVVHAAIAVIARDGRVLVCQRKANDSFGGFWEFPGGGLEVGESLVDCLHRELREELNVAIRIIRPLTPVIHRGPNDTLVLHPFLCDSINCEPTPIECDQFRWICPADLHNFKFPPGNHEMLTEAASAIEALIQQV